MEIFKLKITVQGLEALMRPSNSAKAGISIQIRQCVANHFVGVLITILQELSGCLHWCNLDGMRH
jgi:hypothetical protein